MSFGKYIHVSSIKIRKTLNYPASSIPESKMVRLASYWWYYP